MKVGTIPAEYKANITAFGDCEKCSQNQKVVLFWQATNQKTVTVLLSFKSCGHAYTKEFKFKQWQFLLNQCNERVR